MLRVDYTKGSDQSSGELLHVLSIPRKEKVKVLVQESKRAYGLEWQAMTSGESLERVIVQSDFPLGFIQSAHAQ